MTAATRPRIDDEQRRARLGVRHLLTAGHRAASAEQAVDAVVAAHATAPATVFLTVAARLAEPAVAPTEHALYQDRSLVRMHGMRHTLFVVGEALAPTVHSSTTLKAADRERQGTIADFAARWGSRSERVFKTADTLGHGKPADAAGRLEQLVGIGWAERGLTIKCTACGISSFLPLSTVPERGAATHARPRGSSSPPTRQPTTPAPRSCCQTSTQVSTPSGLPS
ncbi:crosslink repair DNA glycosylase YcaQ family protein [Kitasatospora sp. NPDC051914]|uniref:DNA glycosylase AlkZ-like family protein n=1 Tax=Kitasatospora sp. NPDC051914 TaxID=3154945 RepID=UPI00343AB5DD